MSNDIEIKNMRISKPNNDLWDFRVDRASPVGNPFYMRDESERDTVCEKYETYFYEQLEKNNVKFIEYLQMMLRALKQYGKLNLYCWCAPKRCHAETIKRWLENQIKEM